MQVTCKRRERDGYTVTYAKDHVGTCRRAGDKITISGSFFNGRLMQRVEGTIVCLSYDEICKVCERTNYYC